MYCENCKTYNKDGARFCLKCGKALISTGEKASSEDLQDTIPTISKSENGQQKRTYIWIVPICLIAVIVLAGIGVFVYQSAEGNRHTGKSDVSQSDDNSKVNIGREQKDQGSAMQQDQKSAQEKPQYGWKVEPQIEADDIYYVTCADEYEYSLNELCRQYQSGYAVIRRKGKLGLIDMNGNINGELKYKSIAGYFDSYLLESIEPEYVEEYDGEYSLYAAEADGTIDVLEGWGCPPFEYGIYYCGGLKQAGQNESDEDEIMIDEVTDMPDCPFPIRRSTIVYCGTDVLPWWTEELKGGYAVCSGNGLVTDFIYDECGSCSDGLLAVCKDGKWGYIDGKGEIVIPIEFDASWREFLPYESAVMEDPKPKDYCYAASGGYVVLRKGNEWELRDVSGKTVIPAGTFEEMRPVYDRMCWVKKDGKWGVIELGGNAADSQDSQRLLTSQIYQDIYGPIVQKVYETYEEYNEYCLYDIDKDGTKELLVQVGSGALQQEYEIYTIKDQKSVHLGNIDGLYSSFYEDESGGKEKYLIQIVGFQAEEEMYHISIENGELKYESISSRELQPDEEYYSNPYPVECGFVSDTSLLK